VVVKAVAMTRVAVVVADVVVHDLDRVVDATVVGIAPIVATIVAALATMAVGD
jgi:hypothetical protein